MQVRKKSNTKYLNSFIQIQKTEKMVIPPFQKFMLPIRVEATYVLTNGAVEATTAFGKRDTLLVSPAMVTLTESKTMLQITNPRRHTYTLDSCVNVANFKVMKMQQAANTKPVPHTHVLLMNNHQREFEHILSQLLLKQAENDGGLWYPTSETCDDPSKLNNIGK